MSQAVPHSAVPQSAVPQIFKGIALFTPGGDLVYCIDPHKQSRWHLQLCATLQDLLRLPEPPHFLVPCYAASIDRWLDPRTQQIQTWAEACPLVLQHHALLTAVFGVQVNWSATACSEELCSPIVLSTYRQQFPQLWESHDLVVRFERAEPQHPRSEGTAFNWSPRQEVLETQGYVLRLFVSSKSAATERILQNLHRLLERSLQQPYTLKVIDIHKHPEQAEADQIAATPTLVKAWPLPVRRIVGDLDNSGKLLQLLRGSD